MRLLFPTVPFVNVVLYHLQVFRKSAAFLNAASRASAHAEPLLIS